MNLILQLRKLMLRESRLFGLRNPLHEPKMHKYKEATPSTFNKIKCMFQIYGRSIITTKEILLFCFLNA